MLNDRRAACALTLFVAALAYTAPSAFAADKLRAGKATSDTWPYAALDIGVEEGIFAKYNLDVEVTVLSGGARSSKRWHRQQHRCRPLRHRRHAANHQRLAGHRHCRDRRRAAQLLGRRRADSPIKTVADLKGKTISYGTNGSFPDWLVHRLSTAEGWGTDRHQRRRARQRRGQHLRRRWRIRSTR